MRLLKRAREDGDVSRLTEVDAAVMDLLQAHRFFEKLRSLGPKITGIDPHKLDSHVDYCAQTHAKAQTYLQQVRCASPPCLKAVSSAQGLGS